MKNTTLTLLILIFSSVALSQETQPQPTPPQAQATPAPIAEPPPLAQPAPEPKRDEPKKFRAYVGLLANTGAEMEFEDTVIWTPATGNVSANTKYEAKSSIGVFADGYFYGNHGFFAFGGLDYFESKFKEVTVSALGESETVDSQLRLKFLVPHAGIGVQWKKIQFFGGLDIPIVDDSGVPPALQGAEFGAGARLGLGLVPIDELIIKLDFRAYAVETKTYTVPNTSSVNLGDGTYSATFFSVGYGFD